MATTYTPIATQTLASAAVSVTFSSIPSTYTDLVLVANVQNAGAGNPSSSLQFNGDTATNYSITLLRGNGTTATSNLATNSSYIYMNYTSLPTSNSYAVQIANIMNYANTTTYKTAITRSGAAGGGTETVAGLWRSTSAINSIKVLTDTAVNYAIGSSFTLYGIKAA